jgi:3-oxoacyl-[acyl-carrier protein] reductase
MSVSFNFIGKRFVVTGASSGIGRQIVVELAQAGAEVLAIARRQAELEVLRNNYPDCITIASLDVIDKDLLEETINQFVLKKGKIDGSVHAAGMLKMTSLRAFNALDAKKMMDISFWAGVNLLQLLTKKKNCGLITSHVLISSAGACKGQKGMFAYSATKAAMQAAVRSLAKEIAVQGHRINTISPGWVNTSLTQETLSSESVIAEHLLGVGEPEDISGMVLFLLSQRARWITGANFVVDGGYLA